MSEKANRQQLLRDPDIEPSSEVIAAGLGAAYGELQGLPIGEETKAVIKNAKPMGKTARFIPLVLDIDSDWQLSDVYAIAEFRKIKVK